MKYILITLFSLIFVQSTFSQYDFNFYIIRDNDGWVNVRDEGKIIDRLTNNKLVFVFIENDEDWLEVQYNKESKVMYGSVHRTRLVNLKKLIKIPISKKMDNSYVFSNGLYTINISKEPFIKKNRTIKYSNGGKHIEEIDGQYNWGAELGMPKYQYKDISITKNETAIPFPKSALHNLFEPTLDNIEVYYDEVTNNLYITSLNSDGAGGYIAAWTIENDKYKERLVTHGF